MSTFRPAQIFASINTNQPKTPTKGLGAVEEDVKLVPQHLDGLQGENEVEVTACSELRLEPDRCRVTIHVKSRKEHVQDVKNSVSRRIDYIIQTLHNHQLKETDINTAKILKREDRFYIFDAEVTASFIDFQKCQNVCNYLVEKLDENVKVSMPEFFHSPQRLENLRRQASLSAVSNARQKAAEIAQFLHAVVGQAMSIREEDVQEWQGSSDTIYDPETPLTIHQRMSQATIHVSVKCKATFELKIKGKRKTKKH